MPDGGLMARPLPGLARRKTPRRAGRTPPLGAKRTRKCIKNISISKGKRSLFFGRF